MSFEYLPQQDIESYSILQDEAMDDAYELSSSQVTVMSVQLSQDSQTSVSTSSTRSKRPKASDRFERMLQRSDIEKSMSYQCPCTTFRTNIVSCCKKLSYGDYAEIRHQRASMDPSTEYAMRDTELQEAILDDPVRPRVKIRYSGGSALVCIAAYITICGHPRGSIWRIVGKIKSQQETRPVGRPQRYPTEDRTDGRNEIDSPLKEHTLQWIINWAEFVGEDSPVGDKHLKTIDLVTPAEVYEEYSNEFDHVYLSTHANHVSITTFRRVWNYWIKAYRIRVRDKKNITTKCDGKRLPHFRTSALTHSLLHLCSL